VGLLTAAILADVGNNVGGLDQDEERIRRPDRPTDPSRHHLTCRAS
jgi:UDP-glucose 6-dehydrogenase